MTGKLIVLEGIDRSGKSTLVNQIANYFGCKKYGFPDRSTAIGKLIDSVLTKSTKSVDKCAMHLLFTANRFEAQNNLRSWLSREHVILDRYIHSGIAYSMANGISKEWCEEKESMLIQPDIVIYLSVDTQTSAARKGFGEELYEKKEFQKKVVNAFESLKTPEWFVVDGTLCQETIYQNVLEYLKSKI